METEIAKYFCELGQLKRVKRSGWWLAGVRDPESVAEHTFRTAAIAYVLEGANPEKAAALALFHDTAEARVNDMHRLGKKYADWTGVEEKVVEDQTSSLSEEVAEGIRGLTAEYKEAKSSEAVIARDADRLECLLQAHEYHQQGVAAAEEWIQNSRDALSTDAAKKIATQVLSHDAANWWEED